MKRVIYLITALLLVVPTMVYALGLGQLELNSGLNQPFEARIELLSATAADMSTLNVKLADAEVFQRAGVERLFVLSSLRFEIHETDAGPDFIRVFSVDPIREPYLNFLVEVAWAQGRLYREFTVLLDPPLYDPNARRAVVVQPDTADYRSDTGRDDTYIPDSSVDEDVREPVRTSGYSPGEYGPTTATDTLWSIAASTRPDSSISIQQMMLALLNANPQAFIDGNINGLKRGQILRIPEQGELQAYTLAAAVAEVRSQNSTWQESRGAFATVPTRPITAAPQEDAGRSTRPAADADSSELRLVAASQAGAGTDRGDSTGVSADAGESGAALALANEQLEAITQENLELKDRLSEAESIIEDLRRLISLKDDELAALQLQVTESGVEPEPVTGLELPDEEDIIEDIIDEEPVADEDVGEATPPPVTEPEEATTVVSQPQPISAPKGMVDQVLDMVMENILIVAGIAGGLVLIIIGFVFISRRKGEAAATPIASSAAVKVADFDVTTEETLAPADEAVSPESEALTVLPEEGVAVEEEEPSAEDETVFMAEAEPEAPGEDPLAEVNVFLAYEHFDQAEEFVRDAISGKPDNLDFRTKLLEVFYASGDKAKYEAAARELHDMVDGEGSHWDMTVAMWSEMSPNRALFEEGGEEEAAAPKAATGGGVLDLTAEEAKKPAVADMDLDFDLGDTTDVPAGDAESSGEDILDVTAAVSISDGGEDLLDVTAAVGLEPEPDTAPGGEDEMMLDITAGSEEPAEDLLDVSAQGGDSLLDVTAQADMGSLSGDEDLLDVTSATSAGADSDELLEIDKPAPEAESDEQTLDFDIGGLDEHSLELSESTDADAGESLELDTGGTEEASTEDNVIDFESAASGEDADKELEISLQDAADYEGGLDLDISLDTAEAGEPDSGLSLDEAIDSEAETMEVNLDDYQADLDEGSAANDGLEIDLSIGETAEDEPSLELSEEDKDESGLELDLTIDEDAGDSGLQLDTGDSGAEGEDMDIEATLKMPELEMSLDDEDEDDDDHTVFVPRSADTQEQSEEDEIATKLDLAKAYVELGDKDSAKGILDEIIRDGNEQQRNTAKELLKQVS